MDSSTSMTAMGGRVEVALYDTPPHRARIVFWRLMLEASRLERVFSFYDPGSELSRLNRERSLDASDELASVISEALRYCRLSGGLFDISLGRRIDARKRGLAEPETTCSYSDVIVRGNEITLEHPDAIIDLGGIAKGYIGDRLLDLTVKLGVKGAFIDARGDLRAVGGMAETVDIQHPRREGTLHAFRLEDSAAATSGDYRQYIGTYRMSHIIGDTDFISATCVAPTLTEADAAATCLFLAGTEKAGELMSKLSGVKAIAYDTDVRANMYNGFSGILLEEGPNAA